MNKYHIKSNEQFIVKLQFLILIVEMCLYPTELNTNLQMSKSDTSLGESKLSGYYCHDLLGSNIIKILNLLNLANQVN